ncbi:Re/Si-specific NAD(P)(+) transhydrogenase subunit alpha [Phycisphaeraceae bacterium D3-23]
MRIGVPKEIEPLEKRVAATPQSVKRLVEFGHAVYIQSGAGAGCGFSDADYETAGASIENDPAKLWQDAELVLKIREPMLRPDGGHEADWLSQGAALLCYLQPATNDELLAKLATKNVTAMAVDAVPRITRAQSMDVLSATANLVGYRSLIEAAHAYGSFFSGQMTAAGKLPPAKVLVVGAGVAGLAAIGAAKNLGAVVRGFDTRAATREQVESMGGEFLTVELEESGDGQGGYAKEMSQAFLDAEYALFREQAREVDLVITTALIPGKPAPKLWLTDMVEKMKPGSVVVDLAAERGGNCELTEPGTMAQHHGVKILGYTDWPSRMPKVASTLYANACMNYLKLLGIEDADTPITYPMDDEIVRAMTVTHAGEIIWPPPAPKAPPPRPASAPPEVSAKPADATDAQTQPAKKSAFVPALAALALAVFWLWLRWGAGDGGGGGASAHASIAFTQHLTVFIMACFVGWQVIWNVTPALHTPLMAVTNAISGIIILGGLVYSGQGFASGHGFAWASALGLLAVFFAMINISGGFLVTQRMLKMFRKQT